MVFWLILLAGLAIGTILGVREAKYSRYYRYSSFFSMLGGAAAITAGVLLFFLIFVSIAASGLGTPVAERTGLEALGNDSETSGVFFLGSGVIDDEQVFNYLAKADDGGVTLHSVDADYVVVYEDATEDAYLDRVHKEYYNPWVVPFMVTPLERDSYQFHVPDGAVNREYKVSVTG